MERPRTLERLREAKWGLLEIAVIAILLAFSVGAYSSLSLEWFDKSKVAIASAALFFACVLYISFRHTRDHHLSATLESAVLVNAENEIVSIPEYQVSEDVKNYLDSAFSENPALRRQWDQNPLREMWGPPTSRPPSRDFPSAKLIREVYEYALLEELGSHLEDYFSNTSNRNSNLRVYERNDLPDVLLANRFLELFSRNMEDRPAFSNDDHTPPASGGRVVIQMGPNGYYAHFELTLPKGSALKREQSGKLTITGPAFRMLLDVEFNGFGADVPLDFLADYVGTDALAINAYQVKVHVDVHVRRSYIFGGRRWEEHLWVDSLVSQYEKNFDLNKYLERINWPVVSAVLRTINVRDGRQNNVTPGA